MEDIEATSELPETHGLVERFSYRRFVLLASPVVAAVVVGIVLLLTGSIDSDASGYLGIWIISFIGAASILVPVPALAVLCASAAPEFGLSPLLIGLVAASAEAPGELTGYMAGRSSSGFLQRQRFFAPASRWLERYGTRSLFVVSAVPNPVFDAFGAAAGAIRFPVPKFLAAVFAGKLVKGIYVAYACHYSIAWVERLIG